MKNIVSVLLSEKVSIVIILLLFFPLFISCGKDSETIYVQKIRESGLLLVDYDVWYGRDGNVSGKTILQTVKDFNFRNIEELPITLLNRIPNKDSLDVIYLNRSEDKKKDNTANNKYAIDVNGIKCKITEIEKINGGSKSDCGLVEYSFENFKETEDSLYLFGIIKTNEAYPSLPDNIYFPKGNIKIFENYKIDKQIVRLEIEELKIYNSRGCIKTYYFTPRTERYVDEFSDYGFYKIYKSN